MTSKPRRKTKLTQEDPLLGESFSIVPAAEYGKLAKIADREKYELMLLAQVRQFGLPEPVREFHFHPTRKWRFDFCWPELKIAAEVEGGIFAGGRHTMGAGFRADTEKYNAAAELGWVIFRYEDKAIKHGDAVAQLSRVIRAVAKPEQLRLLGGQPGVAPDKFGSSGA